MFNMQEIWSLILRKIIKIVATRCQILRLKCTKFDFGRGGKRGEKGGTPLQSTPPVKKSWIRAC